MTLKPIAPFTCDYCKQVKEHPIISVRFLKVDELKGKIYCSMEHADKAIAALKK